MEPYTREGLARIEEQRTGKKDPTAPAHHSAEYYRYELAGILVHSGTADSGHYYSFVKVCGHLLLLSKLQLLWDISTVF